MLPIDIPKGVFNNLDKILSKFIWQNKRPRIRLKTLQLSKSNGGLNLPNLKFYFWAAQIKPLIDWIQDNTDTRWVNIEKQQCQDPLKNLPFLDAPMGGMSDWTKVTFKIWNKIKCAFKLPKVISPLINIGHMKTFTPNNLDNSFKKWSEKGLTYLHQLFDGDLLKTFEHHL